MKQTLLLLTLALFNFPLQAADIRYYDVEVIIFEHLQSDSRDAEQWPEQLEREVPENMVEIGGEWPGGRPEDYDPALSFTPLPKSKWRLMAEAEKINSSDSRRLLAHIGWVFPGLSQEQAISVHFNQTVPATQNTIEGAAAIDARVLEGGTLVGGTLDALIRISLARYLRVETDVLFSLDEIAGEENSLLNENDVEGEAEASPTPRYFHAQQLRRRIRSTELHYLDHPVLGMLIMFTPHETKVKASTKKK